MNDQIKRIDGEPPKNKEGDQYQIGGTDQIDGMTGTTVRTKGLVRGVGAQEGRMPHQFRFVQGPSLPVGTEHPGSSEVATHRLRCRCEDW